MAEERQKERPEVKKKKNYMVLSLMNLDAKISPPRKLRNQSYQAEFGNKGLF